MNLKRLISYIIWVCCIAIISSCNDSMESSIPSVRFNLSYSLRHFPTITTPGQFVMVDKNINGLPVGYAGLILGKSVFFSEPNDNNYVCYDAACPVEAQRGIAVKFIEGEPGKAVCPTCETVYDLNNNGFPTGVGKEYLKRYKVVVNGTTIIVQN